MIAGGAESALCRFGIAGFASMKALSTKFNNKPEEVSRPCDEERDGFAMGEGAGDAYHITAPHPEGRGAFKAMQLALKSAQITLNQIVYYP
ncbi:3-oxoacyl-[acyl-carrier-protein] synthase 2 [Araneus ventricosus]|uniref:beta-ketoacyl-[acyl-carrier-protein] synthase I n=1 Tax=Araneus ventricosus TaxID=182803 RepID=A0A4Y1ZTM9_ARAVE|nr:3-oxoacyl-[acyl-carrier-protein] synthase 2 [Araneus ventricosus]